MVTRCGMREALGSRKLLTDDLGGAFQRDDFRSGDPEVVVTLGDRRFGDAEVLGCIGLAMAGFQEVAQIACVDFDLCHLRFFV